MLCLAGALIAVTSAVTGDAATRASTPPPAPRSLLLTAADFSGRAAIVDQAADLSFAYRALGPGLRLGSVRLLVVYTTAEVFDSQADAHAWLASESRRRQRKTARQKEVRTLAFLMAGRNARVGRVTVGHLTPAGPEATIWMASTTVGDAPIRIGFAEVRVDRAVADVALVGLVGGRLDRQDTARAVSLARQRMRSAFVLDVKRPAAVVGVPLVGQVVHADEGEWVGGPTDFVYAWARCDASGATCVEIPGATDLRYTVTEADRGSTLRISVKGRNSVSVGSGTSDITAVVAG